MKEHYLNLWMYNDWANKKVLHKIEDSALDNSRIIGLMSHVLSAQFIWYLRYVDKPTTVFPIGEQYLVRELFSMNEDSYNNWRNVVENNADLEETFNYKNLKGEPFTSSLKDVLTHIINHGTHHRGQICQLLRAEGIDPPVLDFIAFSKE